MKKRPILFNDEMVRAILEGRKTQTRRILDLPKGWGFKASDSAPCILGKITSPHPKKNRFGAFIRREIHKDSGKFEHDIVTCKYGEPGDRLWVREAHAIVPRTAYAQSVGVDQILKPDDDHDAAIFRAGWERSKPGPWRPSIHMPRWASRITLEITDVRVERLKDISEADAREEGFSQITKDGGQTWKWGIADRDGLPGNDNQGWPWVDWKVMARNAFWQLWDQINGPDSWDANPWVWVIEFKRIDQEAEAA